MCKSLNISESNLQSCIFDVAVTNDTTFTDQENFKQGRVFYCPRTEVFSHALVHGKLRIANNLISYRICY